MENPALNLFRMRPADDWRAWYVYKLYPFNDFDPAQPLFVGWCEARELLTLSHARSNSAYVKYTRENPDCELWLLVDSKHSSKEDASKAGGRLVYQLRPQFNMSGYNGARRRRVRCLQNGMEFNSVAEAAMWINCAARSMSSHLSRVPGYLTIKGHEFERVE